MRRHGGHLRGSLQLIHSSTQSLTEKKIIVEDLDMDPAPHQIFKDRGLKMVPFVPGFIRDRMKYNGSLILT